MATTEHTQTIRSNGLIRRGLAGQDWDRIGRSIANTVSPLSGSAQVPMTTLAFLESWGTSLMPRNTMHQGMASGLSMIGANSAGAIVDRAVLRILGPSAAFPLRIAARLAIGAAGYAISRSAPAVESDTERSVAQSFVDSSGRVLIASAIGGAAYDTNEFLKGRARDESLARALITGFGSAAGVSLWASRRLRTRKEEIERWPVEQSVTQWKSTAIAAGLTAGGVGISRLYSITERAFVSYLGTGWSKRVLAGAANAGLWAALAAGLYNAGVAAIGRSNEKIDPGYETPPATPLVSGSAQSDVDFEDLGQQGRRYVSDVIAPEQIEAVMGEEAVAHPIRAFVGFNSEPLYPTGRAEMAMAELERMGAFERSYLLLVSPTGTGWVDHTMIEAAEFLTRGDIATCCIQYGRFPSFLALQKVALGRAQFRLLLWAVNQRLQGIAPEDRPRVLVFGESLGAWSSSDVVMYQGIGGFDHYGIDKALWVGLPGLAKWSRNGMTRGSSDLVPEGTVGVFDTHEQLSSLTDEERERLRAVVLSHDNDPIAVLSPDLLVQRPPWLASGARRGRGVPESMRFIPYITFWQVVVDAMNAMVTVPGEFRSFGHDYRADMARFVRDAYELPTASEEQMDALEQTLRELEAARADRIKPQDDDEGDQPPPLQPEEGPIRVAAGVPLSARRTKGPRWTGRKKAPSSGTGEESA